MVGVMSVCAVDFFGVDTKIGVDDDFSLMINDLIDGDRESAEVHLEHLTIIAPKLVKNLSLVDFEIPCADCAIKRSEDCKFCGGKLLWINPEALHYLQETFKTAVENGESVENAWGFAKQMFDERKALVLSRKSFKGTVLGVEMDGVLIKGDDGKVFFLAEENPDAFTSGQSLEGYCWLIEELSHSYKDGDVFKSIPFNVRNLWWDY